ncbi:hypothetical protein DIPPA_14541 [Diplonema papillatum]|nr:hypothetical protein DIPPA_14541 [Diplonema papillatum]|eukprot:gene8639-13363_t
MLLNGDTPESGSEGISDDDDRSSLGSEASQESRQHLLRSPERRVTIVLEPTFISTCTEGTSNNECESSGQPERLLDKLLRYGITAMGFMILLVVFVIVVFVVVKHVMEL